MKDRRPDYLWPLMALGVVFISSAAVLIKLCPAGPLATAFYRLALAAAVLWPIFFWQGAWRCLDSKTLLGASVAGVFLAGHFGLWIYSLSYTTVASSVVLVTLNPLFVGILGWAILGERLNSKMLLAIVLAVAGGIAIGGSAFQSEGQAIKGNLMALGGALMASLYLLAGRQIRARLDIVPYATICYSVSALGLLAGSLAFGEPLAGFGLKTWAILAALALGPQILGHTVFNWGLKYLSASKIAMLILAEPIGATVLAFFLLGQSPSTREILGGVLILMGIYLAAS